MQTNMEQRAMHPAYHRRLELRRVAVYLAIGAFIALENLASIALFARQHVIPYMAYAAIAQEISILCSFVLNDRLTFRTMTGAHVAWYVRCLRFHSIAVGGGIATVGISTVLHTFLHFTPIIAQLMAIVLMTAVNFVAHRYWTFKGPRAVPPLPSMTATLMEEAQET